MKTLIVIDMQHDFIDGPLGTAEARAIVPKVQNKIEEYVASGDNIIFTRDTHYENYAETQEGRRLPVAHCVHMTPGWCIHKDIQSQFGTAIIDKCHFGYHGWYGYRDLLDVDHVEIIGVCTDICVVSNALLIKAEHPELDIRVNASCCAGTTPENHEAALKVLNSCQIHIIQ